MLDFVIEIYLGPQTRLLSNLIYAPLSQLVICQTIIPHSRLPNHSAFYLVTLSTLCLYFCNTVHSNSSTPDKILELSP